MTASTYSLKIIVLVSSRSVTGVGINTNEDWFHVDKINCLKLRASYGQMGNDQVYYNGNFRICLSLSLWFWQLPNQFSVGHNTL